MKCLGQRMVVWIPPWGDNFGLVNRNINLVWRDLKWNLNDIMNVCYECMCIICPQGVCFSFIKKSDNAGRFVLINISIEKENYQICFATIWCSRVNVRCVISHSTIHCSPSISFFFPPNYLQCILSLQDMI